MLFQLPVSAADFFPFLYSPLFPLYLYLSTTIFHLENAGLGHCFLQSHLLISTAQCCSSVFLLALKQNVCVHLRLPVHFQKLVLT